MECIASAEIIADPLTKPLGQKDFKKHLEGIGLKTMENWLYGKWEML